jgi:D-3-phosphoglycerate dehydrogenase
MAFLLLGTAPQRLEVCTWGIDEAFQVPVTVAAVKGVLQPSVGDEVNYVNAELIADARGIEVVRSAQRESGDYPHLVGVTLSGGGRSVEIDGALFGEREPRVVRFGGYPLEFRPQGKLLFIENRDVPGAVGKIGTLLAEHGVNIADIHLARRPAGDAGDGGEMEALAVLRLDQDPGDELMKQLDTLSVVRSARRVDLGG